MRSAWFAAFAFCLAASVGAAAPPQTEAAPQDDVDPALSRASELDQLYQRLAASSDDAETAALAQKIDRLHLQTDSPTGELLMTRAIAAMQSANFEVSAALLDAVIKSQPLWAEAWNKRATLRYMAGDPQGSMADIAQTLKLEPRHYGALSGMGMILEQAGMREEALKAYERTLALAPQMGAAKQAAERLKAAIAGQSL